MNAPLVSPDLGHPACYPHPVECLRRFETHISVVHLTGRYAYKLKKPIALGFLDFTTLESRRQACEDEVRLNRRFAPMLYLDVVTVTMDRTGARVNGSGTIVDYAVRMREFPQEALAHRELERGTLTADDLTQLAHRVARFQEQAAATPGTHATPDAVLRYAEENFDALAASGDERLAALRHWTMHTHRALAPLLAARHADGHVREGHGDLHLANVVRIDGALTPFDGIEFSAALRWNDVVSDIAFLVMDLEDRGAPELAAVFLDTWLEATGDYAALPLLPYFVVYRALVRAKVLALRLRELGTEDAERPQLQTDCRRYVDLAWRHAHAPRGGLILMHGLSGSGKSVIAAQLVAGGLGIRIRSDVERKRLAGLAALARTDADYATGLYSEAGTNATYARLLAAAGAAIAGGRTAIVDATFLEAAQRAPFVALADRAGVPWALIAVEAPIDVLQARIRERAATGADPSEATLAVLAAQQAKREPLTGDALAHTINVDGRTGVTAATLTSLSQLGLPVSDRGF